MADPLLKFLNDDKERSNQPDTIICSKEMYEWYRKNYPQYFKVEEQSSWDKK